MSGNSEQQPRRPTHEALWPADLFTQGIGWVIVARFKSAGRRVEAGIFLVDVFCLGAKLAIYEDCDVADYHERIRNHYMSEFPMVTTEPACARKRSAKPKISTGGWVCDSDEVLDKVCD